MKIKTNFYEQVDIQISKNQGLHKLYHVYIVIIYSVKHKHTSNESDLRDYKGHSRNYLEIIRMHY